METDTEAARGRRAELPAWVLWAVLVTAVLLLFRNYLFRDWLYVFRDIGSDSFVQYWPRDRLAARRLLAGAWGAWSFELGVGTQFDVLRPALNPFKLALFLLPPDAYPGALAWKAALELLAAAAAWRLYLRAAGVRGSAAVLLPLCFGLNAYLVRWGQHAHLGFLFTILPLLLASLEPLMDGRRAWPAVAMFAWLFAWSYYYGFMVALFLPAYVMMRLLQRGAPGAAARAAGGRAAVAVVLGALLAAWQLLPTALQLAGHPRLAPGAAPRAALGFSALRAASAVLHAAGNHPFGDALHYAGPDNYYEVPLLFVGTLPWLLVPLGAAGAGRRVRLAGVLALLVGAALAAWPAAAWMFNGFAAVNARPSFLVVVLVLFFAARGLATTEARGRVPRGPLFAGLALAAGALAAALAVVRLRAPALLPTASATALRAGFFLALYAALLLAWRPGRGRAVTAALAVLAAAELATGTDAVLNARKILPRSYVGGGRGYYDDSADAVARLQAEDRSFFRIEKTRWSVFLCDAAFQDYRGTRSYLSVNEPAYLRFLAALGVPWLKPATPANYVNGLGERPFLSALFGVKYLLSPGPVEREGLEPAGSAGPWRIYRDRLALPFGFTYDARMAPAAFDALAPEARDRALAHACVADTPAARAAARGLAAWSPPPDGPDDASARAALARRAAEPFDPEAVSPSRLRGRLRAAGPRVLCLSLPFNRGWRATCDGAPLPLFELNRGMTGAQIGAGGHAIELRFRAPGRRAGLLASGAALAACLAAAGRRRLAGPRGG